MESIGEREDKNTKQNKRKRSKSFVNFKSSFGFFLTFMGTRVQGTHHHWPRIFENPYPLSYSYSNNVQKMTPTTPPLTKSLMDDRLWNPEQWNVCKLDQSIATAFKDEKFSGKNEKDKKWKGIQNTEDWKCLVYHESTFRFRIVGEKNLDLSKDFGTFQLSEKYWCEDQWGNPTSPNYLPWHQWQKNECGVPCSKFLDTNLNDDFGLS